MEKLYTAVTQMTPVIYRDFYKIYYRERLKVYTIITAVIGVIMAVLGIYIYKKGFGMVWAVLAVWIGAFLLIYPHVAYRKPYKRARNSKLTTRFAFYEDYISERTNSVTTDYSYNSLLKVIETNKYLLIFHSPESVSIVDKKSVDGDVQGLCRLLQSKTKLKKIHA